MNALAAEPSDSAMPPPPRRIIEVSGSPYERGFRHGEALKAEIGELMTKWKADLAERFGMKAEDFVQRFLERTHYTPSIRKWTPDLWEELRGIADGAGAPLDTVLTFNLVDEYWARGNSPGEHCSSVGIRKSRGTPTIVAQNLDLESYRDGYQILMRIKETNFTTLVVTFPGFIGASGLNSAGVGVVPNTLEQLSNRPTGLPVAFVIRGILKQSSLRAAEKFIRSAPHASGQNYLIGDREKVRNFECSAADVVEFGRSAPLIFHTNHPLISTDFTPAWQGILNANPAALKEPGNSVLRLRSLQSRGANFKPQNSVAIVREMLVAKDFPEAPVCRAKGPVGAFTFASTIMVLGKTPELYITFGPPDRNPYHRILL